MLATAKWTLLTTIINSLLLCTSAIERPPALINAGPPVSSLSAQQQQTETPVTHSTRHARANTAFTASNSAQLRKASWLPSATANTAASSAIDNKRTARNLYAPFDTFSKVDEAPFTDWRKRTDGTIVQSFGAYRSGRAVADVVNQSQTQSARQENAVAQRRSDVVTTVEVIPAPGIEISSTSGNAPITIPKQIVPDASAAATSISSATSPLIMNATRISRQRNYVYIPLQKHNNPQAMLPKRNNTSLGYLGPPAHAVAAAAQEFGEELLNARTDRSDIVSPQTAPATAPAPQTSTDKVDYEEEDAARRNGLKFPSYSLKPASPFYPQGYREDNPIFTETSGFETPYSEDVLPSQYEQDTRHTRQLIYENSDATSISHPFEFPGLVANNKPHTLNSAVAAGKLFREEVTKFGDVNGPITAVPQRPQRGLFFGDTEFRTGPPRPFVPQKAFNEFIGPNGPIDYQSSRKSRFFPFKSSRSPRVVFPVNDNIGTTGPSGTGNGVYFSDSVAFRYVVNN